ncbi:DUF6325 family protein [Actinotalea sp. M2MS4P-6]|uniref:DUF6325 family protein n=1 Tax=Actinotalea sp. M2MS4P-6 TaxID=2983762 RepID=UPI0021E44C3A|nr:DUF6325 family protein [Actinotalea sp. M2MS4P-6]MCV2393319.1 DUF6325 family protein [Actinotalea sp. M2MS4P-6]
MALGPIEVLEIAFPGNHFNGQILPELQRLVDTDVISVIDGIFVLKDEAGEVTFLEFDQLDANEDAARLAAVVDHLDDLISDEDVETLAEGLAPDSSAAILVIEHTWAKAFRDAILDSGGMLVANVRIPGLVVDEVLDSLAAAE